MTSTLQTRPASDHRRPVIDQATTRRHRAGGVAALVKAATYLIGFVVLGAYLAPEGFGDTSPAESVSFLVEHQSVLYAWNTVLYLVGGGALLVLVLALYEQLGPVPGLLRRVTTAVGLLWSGLLVASGLVALVGQTAVVELHGTDPEQAATVWASLHAVQDAFGGGIELVGGVWVLLLAAAGLRWGVLGRRLSGLGVVIGAAGVATLVPALEPLAAVFGIGFIAWYIGIGVHLLRSDPTR